MNKIKEFFAAKKPGYYVLVASVVFASSALILYLVTGRTQFDPNYLEPVIVCWAVGIAFGIFSLVFTIRPVVFGVYLCYLAGTIEFIISQLNFITNVLVGIDKTSFTVELILTVIISAIAFISALTAFFLLKQKQERSTVRKGV